MFYVLTRRWRKNTGYHNPEKHTIKLHLLEHYPQDVQIFIYKELLYKFDRPKTQEVYITSKFEEKKFNSVS
jgi:hypothetical protein